MARRRRRCGGRKRLAFDTREEADKFLECEARPNAVTGQVPIRSFKCPRCHMFHITSKPRRENSDA